MRAVLPASIPGAPRGAAVILESFCANATVSMRRSLLRCP